MKKIALCVGVLAVLGVCTLTGCGPKYSQSDLYGVWYTSIGEDPFNQTYYFAPSTSNMGFEGTKIALMTKEQSIAAAKVMAASAPITYTFKDGAAEMTLSSGATKFVLTSKTTAEVKNSAGVTGYTVTKIE